MRNNRSLKPIFLVAVFLGSMWLHANAQDETLVTGQVTAAGPDHETIVGVNVVVKGTTRGTVTDAEGNYSLTVPSQSTLVFSSIGYAPKEVAVGNRTRIDVTMDADVTSLEEIVIVGYGQQKKKDITGSISSISEKEIANQPAASVDNLLQGRAAGVQISQSSGAPGGRTNIRIRGASSINAGNEPLFVIDGIPVYNNSKDPGGTSYDTFTPTNALASLNPNDIQSIEILKDASATAIYGSRGSNGVIIITTKRGEGDETRVNYNGYYGVQTLHNKLDLMNGEEHARFLNDWAQSRSLPQPFDDPAAIGEGTDWQEEIFRTAPIQNHQLSISSGKGNTKYFISGNYFDQKGIALNSDLKRYSIRINVDNQINDRLKFSQSLTFNRTINHSVPTNSAGGSNIRSVSDKVFATSPTIPVYDENGEYVDTWYGAGKPENPVAALRTLRNELMGDNLLGNMSLSYEIADGLTFKTLAGVNLTSRANEEYYPRETTYIGGLLNGLGLISNRRITNILNENTLRFARLINEVHSIEALGGFTWQTERNSQTSTQPSNFSDDRFGVDNIGGSTGVPEIESSVSEWSLASWLGRVNYQFNNKYLLTATFRADGSSKFGKGNKWGYFPSLAAGYRLSREAFIQNLNLFDDLKIRGSYGITGNQEIGSYQSLARLVTSDIYIFDDKLVSGASQTGLANRDLRWERSIQWDIGLDIALLNNRLRLVADYYEKDTEDLLFTINLPGYSGFSRALYNTGGLRNKGIEVSLGADILQRAFTWTLDANYAHNSSEVTSLGRSASTTLFVGYPAGVIRGYDYDGVFKSQAEVDAQTIQLGVEPGDARYRDVTGDGLIDADDRIILGDPLPDHIFGVTNRFGFKGFSLDVFFQGELGMDDINDLTILNPSSAGSNKDRSLLDRWTPDNPDSDIPRAGVDNWLSSSTFSLQDRSYIKLRNIRLGYTFPAKSSSWLRNANVYLSGQNLVTFTDYISYDPDGGRHYPTAKTVILGFNLGF